MGLLIYWNSRICYALWPNERSFLKDRLCLVMRGWSLTCRRRGRYLGEIHSFPTVEAWRDSYAHCSNREEWPRAEHQRQVVQEGISRSRCPHGPPSPKPIIQPLQAHGLHSHWCQWGPSKVSRLGIGTLLRREQKELPKTLFVGCLPQLPPMKAWVLYCWPGLTAIPFSTQSSVPAPQVACKSMLHC